MTGSDRQGELRFVAALVVVAAALRFLYLGYQSIWVDEMLTIGASTPKEGYSIWHLLRYNIHGPLHSFVVYLFRRAGDGDAWLRVPSALAGVASVAVLYAWVRRWLGRNIARLSAILLAVHPLHIHYSQEVRNYAFVFFFGLLSCYVFDRFCERATPRRGAGYVLAMAAAALSNFTAAFLFVAHTLIYFIRGGVNGKTVGRWVVVCVVILVLISPWVYRIYTFVDVSRLVTPVMPGQIETAERLRGDTTVGLAAIPYAFYTFSVGFTLGPSLRELHDDASIVTVLKRHWPPVVWVALLFGGLLLAGVAHGTGRRRKWIELALYLLVPIVLTFVLNWQNAKAFNARYVLVALPAYLCLIGAGITALPSRWRATALIACVLTMMTSLGHHYFDGRYSKEDVKRATYYIEERMGTTDNDACVLAPTIFPVVERYRTRSDPLFHVFQRDWLAKPRVDAQLDPVFAACNSLWYMRARVWVDDHDGYVWRSLQEHYNVTEEASFDGVEVFHLQRKNDDGESR